MKDFFCAEDGAVLGRGLWRLQGMYILQVLACRCVIPGRLVVAADRAPSWNGSAAELGKLPRAASVL